MHYCLFVKVLFFSLPSGLFHPSALWQFLVFPAKCFAIISQAFLFVKYFFLISSTSFSAPGFPFAAEFYQHTPAPFACPCSGCTPIRVDFLQSVCYQCCVCSPQRMLFYHATDIKSSTFFELFQQKATLSDCFLPHVAVKIIAFRVAVCQSFPFTFFNPFLRNIMVPKSIPT